MHVRKMRIPPPTVLCIQLETLCILLKTSKKISIVVTLLCVRMPVFVIKCYVRQMRHCKVCLKGRGFWGGGVSPPPKKFLYETLVDVVQVKLTYFISNRHLTIDSKYLKMEQHDLPKDFDINSNIPTLTMQLKRVPLSIQYYHLIKRMENEKARRDGRM